MAITHLLAPEPFWTIINNEGTVAGGAKMYTRRSLNKTQDKIVYQDAGGTIPWTNPIVFDLNGVAGPFYWSVDSSNLNDTYYIFVNDADGNLIWDTDNFFPPGSGGGGNVTTYIPIVNYISNNQFIDHIEATASPIGLTDLVIAPSNHKGFTPALITPVVGTSGVVGPDIRFMKNSLANTDQITFPLFVFGSDPLVGDVTPVDYIRYQCTTANAGESYKVFQFPITQKVKNLADQAMTLSIWAAVTATPVTLTAYVRQYFGSGTAASAEVRNTIDTLALTTTWTNFNMQFVVPDVAGKSLGTPGQQTDDDALYIQLEMPLNVACDVLFTKPALYLGNIDPNLEFQNYDEINSVNSTPRTGDVKASYLSSAPNGWVIMDDGSIGNVGSLATTRANQDTFQLYKTLWDGVLDLWAPVSTGRGATAVADFIAGKRLTLPEALGRSLANLGNGATLGENAGAITQSITLLAANLPPHSHTYSFPGAVGAGQVAGFSVNAGGATTLSTGNGPGTAAPFVVPTLPPSTFMNVFIKL